MHKKALKIFLKDEDVLESQCYFIPDIHDHKT